VYWAFQETKLTDADLNRFCKVEDAAKSKFTKEEWDQLAQCFADAHNAREDAKFEQ